MLVGGIDAGGSKTECIIYDSAKDELISRALAGPANYQVVGIDKAVFEIEKAVDYALKKADISKMPPFGIGMAGAGRESDREKISKVLAQKTGLDRFFLTDDGDIALLGATGGKKGMVLIAGTGSIAYGLKEDGRKVRSGGWGPLIGDEGSGFWIGMEAIKRSVRSIEKREKKTSLVRMLKGELDFSNLKELIPFIHGQNLPRRKIASLVPEVFKLAQNNDMIALDIVDEAVEELSLLALSLKKRLNYNEVELRAAGGLFSSDYFYNLFQKKLKKIAGMSLLRPEYSAAYGAVFYVLKKIEERD